MATARRLPGFRFEVESAPLADALPRMDIALLVGFAASGPIDVPVAIEQVSEFTEIFGADVPLAWDLARGEQIYGNLAPAVRAFFQNGGRKCWIVRVAGEGRSSNAFPLAGLMQIGRDGTMQQARAVARSEGSWSDGLSVATAIDRQSLPVTAIAADGGTLTLVVASPRGLSIGDLIRVTFRDEDRHVAFGAIAATALAEGGATRLTVDRCLWFQSPADTPKTSGAALFAAASGDMVRRRASAVPPWSAGALAAIDLALDPADVLPPGICLQLTFGSDAFAFFVSDAPAAPASGASTTRIRGTVLRRVLAPPFSGTISFPFVAERLLLELRVKEGDNPPARLGGLGLAPGHPSFWGSLPTDAAIYSPLADPALAAPGAGFRPPLSPRFALAGGRDAGLSIPVGELLQLAFLDPFADGRSAAVRDGLTVFDRSLFFDSRLVDAGTGALFSRAEFVRYQSSREIQALRGMHSAFFIDEISIAAAPDAVHRRWHTTDETHVGPDSPPHAPPPPHPTPADCPPAGAFRLCDPCTLDAPRLSSKVGDSGRITLTWTGAGTRFAVEESVGPEFARWAPVTTGTRQEFDIYDRPPGEYAYRVTASTEDGRVSLPSEAAFVVVPGRQRAVFDDDYENGDLLDIHRALVRMSAARGDAVALLSLPEHYREDAAIDHVRALTTGPAGATAPLGTGETAALSYAAIYHPWLVVTESGALRRLPPDGPAAGLLAGRALSRGAWIAPANEPLRGVVALTPAIAPERRLDLLLDQINIVRQEPRGFVLLSADTLASGEDLRPLNVRRLLILLRRAALQLGATYVFEPNGDAFRRMVQRGFEEMLGDLHARGAFAGRLASNSFQVVTDEAINTGQAQDLGRFFVELRVAPSVPLTFLTLRLIRTGDRMTVEEGR